MTLLTDLKSVQRETAAQYRRRALVPARELAASAGPPNGPSILRVADHPETISRDASVQFPTTRFPRGTNRILRSPAEGL